MTKPEIIAAAGTIFSRFSEEIKNTNEALMFTKPTDKWSVAENVQHLIISTNATALAFWLPRFLVQWLGGTANRPSRTFDELQEKYYKKLSDGGVASARFVPKPISLNYGKKKLMSNWHKACSKFITALQKNRTEKDLDAYLVKHPLLGRITLRELCYFSIFHTEHHLLGIKKITNS